MLDTSENVTFRVLGGPRPAVLRLHRRGYQTRATIAAELDWLAALADVPELAVVEPITAAGRRILSTESRCAERLAVLFAEIPGAPVDPTGPGGAHFGELGAIAARLHAHVATWRRPAGFDRFSWGLADALGPRARWGDWRSGPGVTPRLRGTIAPAVELVARRLAAFGTAPDRFGLIHADLRATNLMCPPRGAPAGGAAGLTVIDFDDCGFGWYLYDFAAAVSFVEHDPRLGEWAAQWLAGYATVGRLAPDHVELLPTLVMMRRLQLLAWLGGHPHAAEAADHTFADGTADLASRFAAGRTGTLW
ncbi:phosphotransferase enzyme family protein [Tsukamurella soli]|uniref:phosphotransferase enzyme family protein n=1 Tax=Tsukamurella soli TaxID=644556 RepID=UPI0036236338